MTYDCFPFFNELDLLEIRLNTLDAVVDRFVIAEAPWTFTGQKKPLFFEENKARFAAFEDKIIHITAGEPPLHLIGGGNASGPGAGERELAWLRENFQRNELARGLADAKPGDTILVSDVDEIPSPEAVLRAKNLPGTTRFLQNFYNFFLNFRNYSVPVWPIGTVACSYGVFTDPATYKGQKTGQYLIKEVNDGPTVTRLRWVKAGRELKDAGWHFSFCGGLEAVRTKFAAYPHTECKSKTTDDLEALGAAISAGRDPAGRGYRFFAEPPEKALPEYVLSNIERFRPLLLDTDAAYLRRTRPARLAALAQGMACRAMVKCVPPFLVPFALKVQAAIRRMRQKT